MRDDNSPPFWIDLLIGVWLVALPILVWVLFG